MLSKKLEQAVNEQIKNELYSGYLYLAMAAQCESMNLSGFAHWLKIQAKEELGHAMKFYGFINDRGGRVVLEAIDKPPVEYKSLQDMFEAVYQHEQKVTGLINKLYEMAKEENDYPLQVHFHWVIDEQVEEEKNAAEILAHLKLVGETGSGLMILDKKLGEREE
ncbi:MAG: ferritin [Atribacterota bacterium]|nr:ferritin [Atribacterota bacterium]